MYPKYWHAVIFQIRENVLSIQQKGFDYFMMEFMWIVQADNWSRSSDGGLEVERVEPSYREYKYAPHPTDSPDRPDQFRNTSVCFGTKCVY